MNFYNDEIDLWFACMNKNSFKFTVQLNLLKQL